MDMSTRQLKRLFHTGLIVLICVGLYAKIDPVQARDLVFQSKKFVYKAENKPLADVLRDFAASQSTPIIVADGVTGVVNASFDLPPQSFLKTMSLAFGVIWYFDGVMLYVYPSQLMQTQFFKIKGYDPATVLSRLKAFGLGDTQYPLKYQAGDNMLMAYGPPRHIELVEAMVTALNDTDVERSKPLVQVFALRHAYAVDRRIGGITLPGMASTLRATFAPVGAAAAEVAGALNDGTDATIGFLNKLKGTPEQRLGLAKAAKDAGSLKVESPKTPKQPMIRSQEQSNESSDVPLSFVGDEATNSVIARLPPHLVKGVSDLIARLDAPNEMIEISATIIDISSDELETLGFDWRYQSSRLQVSANTGVTVPLDNSGVLPGAGFNVTTLLSNAGRELLSRIRALESKGSAQIVAQPKVLGAANRTAILTDKRTASVRVAGNLDAQLFSVEAGTTLQVIPRLIADPQHPMIGLDLFIEDGGFSEQIVDQIPVVQRTTVRTDAVLNEGQSLLIGGITVESRRNGTSSVPGISRIPLIGGLFRSKEQTSQRRERIFLLTPRRVSLEQMARDSKGANENVMPLPISLRMDNSIPEKVLLPGKPLQSITHGDPQAQQSAR
jgi:type III secretion protein C